MNIEHNKPKLSTRFVNSQSVELRKLSNEVFFLEAATAFPQQSFSTCFRFSQISLAFCQWTHFYSAKWKSCLYLLFARLLFNSMEMKINTKLILYQVGASEGVKLDCWMLSATLIHITFANSKLFELVFNRNRPKHASSAKSIAVSVASRSKI